jgi:hypothetical protein
MNAVLPAWLPSDEVDEEAVDPRLEILGTQDESLHPLTEVLLEHVLHALPEAKLHVPPACAAGGF